LLTYERLQNMMAFVLAAAYFTAVRLGTETKLRILAANILPTARRLFGIPDFRYYALADGILSILRRFRPRGRPSPGPGVALQAQLAIFDLWFLGEVLPIYSLGVSGRFW
jgi:hypothetical protein